MTNQEKEEEYTESHVFDNSTGLADKIRTKDKIAGKVKSVVLGKPETRGVVSVPEAVRISNNIRTILLGLFALIGFIVLVFAIFTASVGVGLAQTAASVFMAALIAAIVGAFALLGVVLYPTREAIKMR